MIFASTNCTEIMSKLLYIIEMSKFREGMCCFFSFFELNSHTSSQKQCILPYFFRDVSIYLKMDDI